MVTERKRGMKMQDRYLFRGKRIDNGEWVVGNCIDDGVTGQVFIHAVGNSVNESDKVGEEGCLQFVAFEVAPSTICQCTGLKDKNGRVIWENDIVNGSIKRGAAFYRCLVLWNECKARFDVRALCCNFQMTLDECTDDISMSGFDYEVLGNKFDNQELLEE
jgi:hypothetical protein